MVALALVVQLVSSVSGFAQADTSLSLQRTSFNVARKYVPVRETRGEVDLPSNLFVSSMYRRRIELMLAHSATFRRQCVRLANASNLVVVLQSDTPRSDAETRAVTTMVRGDDGGIRAVVRIRQSERVTELIAHEIEHVIEQLDGVDLKALSQQDASGVRRCRCTDVNTFETQRAVNAGLQVAREVGDRTH